MKRILLTALIASALALAVPLNASAMNPIFGNAKVQTLDTKQMKSVVGQNSTSAYYAYLGNWYAGAAAQFGSYGAYLEVLGSTYQSSRNYYYYYAYYYSAAATANYYYAYINN
jgi:hypothetical protein